MTEPQQGEPGFNPSFIPETERTSGDTLAREEALKFGAGEDLKTDGEKREHARHQAFREHVNRATILIFWIIVESIVRGIVAFTWHMVTPTNWHYLDEDQLDQLKAMLGAAVLSSALTGYVNRRMSG